MRKRILVFLLLALGVNWVSPAADQLVKPLPVFYTGNTLLELCQSSQLADEFACSAYIIGVADGSLGVLTGVAYIFESKGLGQFPGLWCYPENVTPRQIRDLVVQHLGQHPETRHQTAALMILTALREAFPCQE